MANNHSDDHTHTYLPLNAGTMVSHYRILEKIGAGGMSEVFLAEDTKLKRKVALKFLSAGQAHDKSVVQQFMHEAQAAAKLQHPNIVTVHEASESEGVPFISMEYVKGQSLREAAETKSFSTTEIIKIGIQIAKGLAVAHESGITHRDLKPGNIMIDSDGTVRILDFGLAVFLDTTSSLDPEKTVTVDPSASKIAGTIPYMAPEQLLGQEVNCLVDIFALGTIMHELVTGRHPFGAPSISEISANILRDTPKRLTNENANVPYDLDRIVHGCLKKDPLKRFQSARDVCNELEELNDQLSRNVAVTVVEGGQFRRDPILAEKTYVINTELVRTLTDRDPRMIGSSLAYLDNEAVSDALVFYLHPLGADHGYFSDVLQQLPYRAIAISVFGFERNAQLRRPVTLRDHSVLIHALIKDVSTRLRPRDIVLAGNSSGSDHILHMLTSDVLADVNVTGVLALGCNIHFDDCFASARLADLTDGDEEQIMSIISLLSQMPSSLNSWLVLHDYLVASFSKFRVNTAPLSQYASDIVAPFRDGSLEQFSKWYRYCTSRVPHIQCVIDTDGYPCLDRLMQKHLENNILGDDFREETIVRAPCSHMELGNSEMVLKYTLEFVKSLEAKRHSVQ